MRRAQSPARAAAGPAPAAPRSPPAPQAVVALLVLAALVLAALPPPAQGQAPGQPGQGERVDVVSAEFPPVVVADRPFHVNVTVQNRAGDEQRITLFATLYEGTPGQGSPPCDGARASHSISKFQKSLALAPGERRLVEGERDHWAQVVNGSRLGGPGTYEVCVWARLAQCPREADLAACFLDSFPLQQSVRLRNAPPAVSVQATPLKGTTATRFDFTAGASDPDGDQVRHRWSFGDGGSGTGARVSHQYDRPGAYEVVLNATDGFDHALATVRIEVAPPSSGGSGVPGPGAALAALALLTAAAGRGPRPR